MTIYLVEITQEEIHHLAGRQVYLNYPSISVYWSYFQIAGCQPVSLPGYFKLDMLGFGRSRMLRINSKF